jgi:hypothetical protein
MNLLDAGSETAENGEPIAITQSLCARDATLESEDDAEFNRLVADFRREYQPAGPTEDYLVQQMAASYWKSRRLTRLETGALTHQSDLTLAGFSDGQVVAFVPTAHGAHDNQTLTLGKAVHEDCAHGNVLVKLTNCASMVDRAFHRALQQLQHCQAGRTSQPAPKAA